MKANCRTPMRLLPHTTSLTDLASATFTPAAGEELAGFRVRAARDDPKPSTNPNRHPASGDCSGDGRHLVRYFPTKDRSDAPIKEPARW